MLAGFRVTPYLQNPAPGALTLSWLSDDPGAGRVALHALDGGSTIRLSSSPVEAGALDYHPAETLLVGRGEGVDRVDLVRIEALKGQHLPRQVEPRLFVAEDAGRRRGIHIDPARVVVTPGAKPDLFFPARLDRAQLHFSPPLFLRSCPLGRPALRGACLLENTNNYKSFWSDPIENSGLQIFLIP